MRLGWIRGFVVLFSGDDVFHEAIPPLVGKVTHGLQDVPKGKFVIVKSGVSEMKVTHGLQDVPKGKFVIMKSGVSEMNLVTVNSNSGFRFDTRDVEATHLICVNAEALKMNQIRPSAHINQPRASPHPHTHTHIIKKLVPYIS
jgi:hypothetical protein